MSTDETMGPGGSTFGSAFADAAAEAAPNATEPRVHVGVGAVFEKKDGGRRGNLVIPNLAASRRCAATIPENLNDIWWRDAKMDKPVDGEGVLFIAGNNYCSGARIAGDGAFHWLDGNQVFADADVAYWSTRPSVPK